MNTLVKMAIALAFTAAMAVASTGNSVDDLNLVQSNIVPEVMQQPSQSADTTEQVDTTEQDSDDEAWKSNLGSITLGETITYEGEGISVEGSTVHITAGGDYSITGTLTNGMIHVNTKEKVKLRLDGVDITNTNGPAIFFEDAKKAFITISSGTVNNLSDSGAYTMDAKATLFSNDTLEIKGSGTLNITGGVQHAIASDDDILIENGNINILGAVKDGIHANDNVTVTGGTLNIKATSDAIDSEGDVVIGGGSLIIDAGDDGIHADTELTVTAGDINITNCYEGLEGKTTITINDGNIRIIASDDPINSGENAVINGGYIYAEGGGDGIDSNGSLTINGGTVIVFGAPNGEGPIDVGEESGGTFTVNGGTVFAGGGNMRVNVSENSQQRSVWIGGQFNAGTLVNIAGNDVSETFTMVKQGSLIFYSSDKLTANGEYTVSSGGSSTGTATDGYYSGGEYSGGTQLGSFTAASASSTIGSVAGGMGGGGMGGGNMGERPEGGGNMGERPEGNVIPNDGQRPERNTL